MTSSCSALIVRKIANFEPPLLEKIFTEKRKSRLFNSKSIWENNLICIDIISSTYLETLPNTLEMNLYCLSGKQIKGNSYTW